jgi:hypothetical protein
MELVDFTRTTEVGFVYRVKKRFEKESRQELLLGTLKVRTVK